MAVSCGLASQRRNRWLILLVLFGGFSVWHLYDGFVSDKYKDEPSDLKFNQVGGVVLSVMTLGLVVALLVLNGKSLRADQQGISYGGKSIPWSDFTEAQDQQLSKGLLTLLYKSDSDQQPRKLLLDDYKLSNFEALLDEIATYRPDLVAPEESGDQQQNQAEGGSESQVS